MNYKRLLSFLFILLLGFALTYLYQGLLESFEGSSGKHAK